jgi:hypothetical protein
VKARKPRTHTRVWYPAKLEHCSPDTAVLTPRAGSMRVVVDESGVQLSATREPYARLIANRDDMLIVCGATPDETQGVTVRHIEQLRVTLGHGGPVASGLVHVLRARRAS